MDTVSNNTFFFARQPILDRNGKISAYELLYRSSAVNLAGITPQYATEQVIINALNLAGLGNLIERGAKAYVNINDKMLFSSVLESIPKSDFILELLETIDFTPDIISRVEELHKKGYTFALDDIICSKEIINTIMPLLPFVDIIKLDLPTSIETVKPCIALFKRMGISVLAEKIETPQEYHTFYDLGCDLFQGYYFARPILVTGKKIDAKASRLLQIITLLNDEKLDDALELFEQDAALTLQLLRYLNSAAFSFKNDIKSVRQAILLLGSNYLKQWLTLMTYAMVSQESAESPLLRLAQERANMMELFAVESIGQEVREQANFIGLLSLIDALFQQPMDQLLSELHVDNSITDVLLRNSGNELGKIYQLVIAIEATDDDRMNRLLDELGLDFTLLANVVKQSYEITEKFQQALQK